MRIIGHGIDICDTDRIAHMLKEHGDRFLERCFLAQERAYAVHDKRRVEHLAGRFAAKEAVLKALGTGLSGGITWLDVEVVREASGRPNVALHGEAAKVAIRQGINQWMLSITHNDTHAVASAIACGE